MDNSPHPSPRTVAAVILLAGIVLADAGCGSSASPELSQAQLAADDAFLAKFEATKDGKAALRAMKDRLRYPDGKPPAPTKRKSRQPPGKSAP